jgi:hypothetical protein
MFTNSYGLQSYFEKQKINQPDKKPSQPAKLGFTYKKKKEKELGMWILLA